MASRRPRRYLKTFLEPVASSWLNMSPWRAMAVSFVKVFVSNLGPFFVKFHKQILFCGASESGQVVIPRSK